MNKGILFEEKFSYKYDNKIIFETLKSKIKKKEFCNLNLQPSINPMDIPNAEDIIDDFLKNKYYGYVIFGVGLMDRKFHGIYRDKNDKLYTFFIYEICGTKELHGLKEFNNCKKK